MAGRLMLLQAVWNYERMQGIGFAHALSPAAMEFSYQSSGRAIAILDREPRRLRIDGRDAALERAGSTTLFLPPGQHAVTITAD